MAVTLAQAALDQRGGERLPATLIQLFDYFSPIMSEIPMDGVDELFYDYERVAALPSIGWRALNSAWTESSGATVPFREYLKVLGGEVKVDVQLARGAKGRKTIDRQTMMKVQAATNEWDRAFLEGSELSNPNEMVGLRARISGGQALTMATAGGTLTLARLNDLRDAVPFATRQEPGMKRGEGVKVCMYMSRDVRNKIDELIGAQTGSLRIETSKDNFGRMVEKWRDAELKIVEQTGTGNTFLGYDEDPGDGTADTASIYCVAFGDNLVHGLYRNQSNDGRALRTFRRDEMETEPRMLIRWEGMYGVAIDHPRAAARLGGINNA